MTNVGIPNAQLRERERERESCISLLELLTNLPNKIGFDLFS